MMPYSHLHTMNVFVYTILSAKRSVSARVNSQSKCRCSIYFGNSRPKKAGRWLRLIFLHCMIIINAVE